jgi:phage FluMu gp28-like protein
MTSRRRRPTDRRTPTRRGIGEESRPEAGPTPSQGKGRVDVVELDGMVLKNDTVLRGYQRRWAKDEHRFTIAVKSAQIGYSTASAAWAVYRCLVIPKRTIIFLSRSERQSLELAHRAKEWLDGYHGVAADWLEAAPFAGTSTLQHEIRFPNGPRIIALAANPDTARGYTGDVVLDEFAFHADSQAIFTAVYRQVSLGYHMRVLSTPNGQRGKFWELARSLGLDLGLPPADQPVRVGTETDPLRVFGLSPDDEPVQSGKSGVHSPESTSANPKSSGVRSSESTSANPKSKIVNPWSGHWCDIFMAVKNGLPLDPQEVQAGCDEDTWLQEYCCQFISQYSEWIPAELFQQCVSSEASSHLAIGSSGDFNGSMARSLDGPILYAGWDIARKQDLSVIWLSELVGDVSWTRGLIEMRNTPTPDQLREARALMPFVRRLAIDKTGMGMVIFETLEREFPGQVEGVQFTQQKKEAMAVLAKRRMEEMKVRLPDSEAVRQAFRAVKKTVNAVGQVRFDAEHDARAGHADHWWAFCLAETAAQQPVYHFKDTAMLFGRPVCAGMREAIL